MLHRRYILWKAGIVFTGILFLLIIYFPVSLVDAHLKGASSTPITEETATLPAEDATMTALSKEQMTWQVKQLQNQLQNQNNWLMNNSTALITAGATLVVAVFGIFQWAGNQRETRRRESEAENNAMKDRKEARKRQVEERFQAAVSGLGDDNKEGARVGAAILLRTFL